MKVNIAHVTLTASLMLIASAGLAADPNLTQTEDPKSQNEICKSLAQTAARKIEDLNNRMQVEQRELIYLAKNLPNGKERQEKLAAVNKGMADIIQESFRTQPESKFRSAYREMKCEQTTGVKADAALETAKQAYLDMMAKIPKDADIREVSKLLNEFSSGGTFAGGKLKMGEFGLPQGPSIAAQWGLTKTETPIQTAGWLFYDSSGRGIGHPYLHGESSADNAKYLQYLPPGDVTARPMEPKESGYCEDYVSRNACNQHFNSNGSMKLDQ